MSIYNIVYMRSALRHIDANETQSHQRDAGNAECEGVGRDREIWTQASGSVHSDSRKDSVMVVF